MKTLVVTDLHLMEKEFPYTKGGVHNSGIILDELIRVVSLDKEIGLIVLLGDIMQHNPKRAETKMMWTNKFDKLKRLVNGRHEEMPDITIYRRDGSVGHLRNRLLTLKGNHDYLNNDRWDKTPTYFDDLVAQDIISMPEAVEFADNGKRYYYHFRSFGEGDKTLGKEAVNADKVIAFTHDCFFGNGMPDEYNYWSNTSITKFNIGQAVYGTDVFIQGHTHSRFEPFTIKGKKYNNSNHNGVKGGYDKTKVYVPGSNARTSFNKEMYRNDGYNMVIDTEDFYIGDVFIFLKPYEDYYDMNAVT